jgi:4-hydroxy-tetrahydrodipicolinate synthase
MKQNIFRGLGVALITPFTESGEVDYNALGNLVEYQISNGADFLCILATTSESPCLSKQEKLDIQHFIVNLVDRRVPIVIGCGGNNTYAIAEELRNGDFNGIDGILSVCPYYNKPTQEGLYQHFKTLACATELPVILYNVPGRTGINMTAETTLRLANDCENIVAIKEASGNLEQIDDILKNKPEGFAVLSGDDSLTFPMLAGGAEGVISVIGNALPKEFSQMISLEQAGKYEEAVKIHHSLTELYKLLFVDGNPAGVKAVLTEMGYIKNVLRLPLVPARETTIQKISQSLQELKLQA